MPHPKSGLPDFGTFKMSEIGNIRFRWPDGLAMLVLGIETTCDETAAAVVDRHDDGRATIVANVVLSQIAEHAAFGGVEPEVAARAHVEALDLIIATAMAEASRDFGALDGVAVAAGPG